MRGMKQQRRLATASLAVIAGAGAIAVAPVEATPLPAATLPAAAPGDTPVGMAVNEEVGRIERAYLTILGRVPDVDGLTYWLEQNQSGLSYDAIVDLFLSSPERQRRFGSSVADSVFLDNLYADALSRTPDDGGKAYWLAQLANGVSRVEVVKVFADSPEQRARTQPQGDFTLNILHMNDHHSHLDPDGVGLTLAGADTDAELGGFPSVVAKFKELEAANAGEPVMKIHAGDAITGTLYYSLFGGEADAALMNEICFDAFELGNHEFDGSDSGLKEFLDHLAEGDCNTPVLGANVLPKVGTPLAMEGPNQYIRPWIVKPYGDGEYVAYIGLDIADKTKLSSSPLKTTQFLDEVETAQRYVDEMTRVGINKIVLVTHYQYANDLRLASQVSGVDVIIGGDSHTLLGDFDEVGLTSGGPYPTMTTDAKGLPVCIAQAWQYSAVVGELEVSWDRYGHVAECSGTPHLILGEEFTRPDANGDDVALSGADLAAVQAYIDGKANLDIVTPDPAAQAILDGYAADVAVLEQQVIGRATTDLCLERIPGQGRSTIDGCLEKTAQTGGEVQQLVADGFLARSFEADIALQNSGGVRVDILAGDYTIADAYELLPFANTMVNMEMTGAQIVASIEEGIENATRENGSSGAYPYASGLRWDADLTKPQGQRVTNVEVRPRGATSWTPIGATTTYTVVTNNFMASGGDGYFTMGEIFDAGKYVDTYLDYAQGWIDYVEQDLGGVISAPTEFSTKSFVPAP
ncbi:MAG: 5'-nucleotidase C-terminal domain-containing protein [Acidimicrobiales bacterium]